MSNTPFNLEPGEQEIDNWAIWYHSPEKKASQGKLYVTNKRIFFVPDDKGFDLNISKDQIEGVQERKSIMSKSAEVKTKDGNLHLFDRGMLSAEKVVNAINQR